MSLGLQMVDEAEKFLHDNYVYGGDAPPDFDCSGLVQYSAEQVGINLPRTSEEQYAAVQHITQAQLAPGDLVFAQFPGDNASPGHVGIYVGNGQVLSAEDPQAGIGYSSLASWAGNIVGYGQLPGNTATTSDITTDSNLVPGWLQGILGVVPGGQGVNELGSLLDPSNWVDWAERGALMLFGGILIIMGVIKLTGNNNTVKVTEPPNKPEAEDDEGAVDTTRAESAVSDAA